MKVNVIKIEGEEIKKMATLSVPSRELDGTVKIFDWISRFDREQASEIFGVPIRTLNVAEYTEGDGFITTYRVFKGRSKDTFYRNSFQIDGRVNPETKITQKNPVLLADGTEADFSAGFDFYPEGYILSTGTTGVSMFGSSFGQYVAAMSARKIKYGKRNAAKVFPTLKKLKETLLQKEDFLHFFAEKNGFHYSFEPVNDFFAAEEAKTEENPKRKSSHDALRTEIQEILNRINQVEETESDSGSFLPGATPEEEAVNRMKELGLMNDVIRKFQKGELLVSETGGILYNPDENAQDAIEDTKQYGLPYHVIRSGEMYSVLYVSNHPDEWEMEHYNRREHYITANVWNADGQFSELGDIWAVPANGGLVRTE